MRKGLRFNLSAVTDAVKTIYNIRKQYIQLLAWNALVQAVKPFIPIVLSALILDELLGDKDVQRLMILAGTLVVSMLVIHVLSSYLVKGYDDENKLLINSYFFELSKKSMRLEYSYIEKKETMDLMHQIEGASRSYMAIWNIAEYLQRGALAILEILIAGVLITTMMVGSRAIEVDSDLAFIQSPVTFGVMSVVFFVGLYFYSYFQGKLGETAANDMKGHVAGNRIFGYLFFHMSSNYENGKDIRLYSAQKLIHEKMKVFVKGNYQDCDENFVKPNIKNYSWISVVNVFMLVAVYIFIILKAYVGAITVGSIFIQINAIMRLYDALGSFLKQYNMLKAACEHFKYSIEFFALPEMKREGAKSIPAHDNYIFRFENVSFKYPSSDELVLDEINLTIESGHRMAVVGMNGAGKTTMIKLLCRLYEPTEGRITLNGVDIREYDYSAYIDLFSVVFQDFKLFAFGLDRNVAVGDGIDDERLKETLVQSGLENVVDELESLEVAIGKNFDEEGRDFSGGEKQKIAIARALYKDAPIIVLDEPTAALDPVAEYEIYAKFNQLIQDKAAIFISHRLSSCRFCHNIAVFDKGKIVELGDHDSLLENEGGKYAELWNAQADHYVY